MTKEEIANIVGAAKDQTDLAAVKEYKVMNDHCIVAPVEFNEKDESGLVKPTQYEDKNEYGVVLASGPGRVTENGMKVFPQFSVGDVVLYGQYSYSQLRVNGYDLNLIRHDDIIAVLPKGKESIITKTMNFIKKLTQSK